MHLALLGSWEGDGGHGWVPGLRAPDRANPPPPPRSLYDLVWLFRRTWGLLDILPMTPTALDQPTTRSRKTVPECTSQTEVSQSVKANYEGFSSRFPERLSTSSVTGTDDPRTRTLARVPEGRRGSGVGARGVAELGTPRNLSPSFCWCLVLWCQTMSNWADRGFLLWQTWGVPPASGAQFGPAPRPGETSPKQKRFDRNRVSWSCLSSSPSGLPDPRSRPPGLTNRG